MTLPKDAEVRNSTKGKLIPTNKLLETLEVDWFDDGVLGAGVVQCKCSAQCKHGPMLEQWCGKTPVSLQQKATNVP